MRRMDSVSCVRERSRIFANPVVHESSFSTVFWFLVNLISLPPPILYFLLADSQVTPVAWWHMACPSSSSTKTLWMWVQPPLTLSDQLPTTLYSLGIYVFVCAQEGGQLCDGVLSRLLWELGCGPQPGWWVGLFVCSQVQVIKVSGVPLEKGMKRDNLNYHFFPSLSFTTSHTVLRFIVQTVHSV